MRGGSARRAIGEVAEVEQLSIYVLGPFRVHLGEETVTDAFRTKKERALLAYLAVEAEKRHRREALAEMLWHNRPEGYARTNLRQALLGLRRVIGGDYIQVNDEAVEFKGGGSVWLDANAFREGYQRALSHSHAELDRCESCAAELEQALELYRGDFLDEVFLNDSPLFQEWCVYHREQNLRYMLGILENLSNYYKKQGEYERAHHFAWRYVNTAPLEEVAHRQLMSVLALSGRRSAALEQYHTCRRLLVKELGVEPAEETRRLYEAISRGQLVEPGRVTATPAMSRLPEFLTSFVGREAELERLEECLVNPECRLITLIGMPGAGKTRLVVQAARRRSPHFPDGVHYLGLREGGANSGLAERLLQSLGVTLQLNQSSREQLLERLAGMRALFILDNFENHLGQSGLLLEILRRAPGVKILLTSQERLNFQSACVFFIGGLEVGDVDAPMEAAESAAVKLFLGRARHSRAGFLATTYNLPYILRICQLVEGLPLGIELAAAALRERRSEEIVALLENDLEVLKTSMLDLPPQHRSMIAALTPAWERLSEDQQELMRRLASFEGEFSAEESGAEGVELDRLVDMCWLETARPQYYRLHHLARLFVQRRAETGRVSSPRRREVLPGRGMFWDRLEHLLARAERYGQTAAVILLALEEDAGVGAAQAQVDQAVLKRLTGCLRKSDTAALLDRGLFGIILEDVSRPENTLKVVEKLMGALREPIGLPGLRYTPKAQMGVSVYPLDGLDAEALVERAEEALQAAQRA